MLISNPAPLLTSFSATRNSGSAGTINGLVACPIVGSSNRFYFYRDSVGLAASKSLAGATRRSAVARPEIVTLGEALFARPTTAGQRLPAHAAPGLS